MPRSASQNFCCQCPCPHGEPQPTPASAGDPPTLAGRSGSVSYEPCGVTAPSPGSWYAHYFVCALQEWSLCSPIPVNVLQSNSASLQSMILWEFLLPLPHPQVGKPDMGLRTFTPVDGVLWYNCSPVCESPTQWLWDLILLWLCPSYHLILASPLSFDMGYLFGEFQCIPVDDCSAISCDSSALTRESEHTSFYSAILNQFPTSRVFIPVS